MSKGALKAREVANDEAKRAARARGREAISLLMIEQDFAGLRADFALVLCDGCGLEQVTGDYPCAVCGAETCTTSPRHDAVKLTLSGVATYVRTGDTERVREPQQRR